MNCLKPICFICLNPRENLNPVNLEMLTKLTFCIEKADEFIPPISDRLKICTDCLDKLDIAFQFKKMCLYNIVQFKDYINLSDISKDEETENVFIKKEHCEQNEYFDDESKEICNQFTKIDIINEHEPIDLRLEHPNDHFETVLVKEEVLEETQTNNESQEFRTESNLIGKQLFSCPICQKTYKAKISLTRHMFSHTNERPHVCEKCDKNFTVKENLKSHMLTHSEIKQYSCSTCGKSFRWRHYLKTHMLIHTNIHPHSCDKCEKSFTTKDNLKTHMLTHTEIKQYSCTTCGKCFTLHHHLKRHLLIHTDQRPYSCSLCGRGFIEQISLKQHMLIHTNERPNSCTICGKGFIERSNMRQHMLTHTSYRPHCCPICGKGFIQKSNMNRHVLTHNN